MSRGNRPASHSKRLASTATRLDTVSPCSSGPDAGLCEEQAFSGQT